MHTVSSQMETESRSHDRFLPESIRSSLFQYSPPRIIRVHSMVKLKCHAYSAYSTLSVHNLALISEVKRSGYGMFATSNCLTEQNEQNPGRVDCVDSAELTK